MRIVKAGLERALQPVMRSRRHQGLRASADLGSGSSGLDALRAKRSAMPALRLRSASAPGDARAPLPSGLVPMNSRDPGCVPFAGLFSLRVLPRRRSIRMRRAEDGKEAQNKVTRQISVTTLQ
jgi:hypothetical protein